MILEFNPNSKGYLYFLSKVQETTPSGKSLGICCKRIPHYMNLVLLLMIVVNSYYKIPYADQFFIEILKALEENQHLKYVKFQGDAFNGIKILTQVMDLLQKNTSLKVEFHSTGLYNGGSRGLIQDLMRRNEQYLAVLNDSFQTIAPTSTRVFFCGFPHAGTHLQPTIVNDHTCSKKLVYMECCGLKVE